MDEITLNDSPDPRSEIVNGVKDPRSGSVLVYADAQRIHVSDVSGNAGVKVYNAIGMVIRETTVEHIADMTVDRGLYIVLTESNGKKSINKVLVK